jgi:hypothetical protein
MEGPVQFSLPLFITSKLLLVEWIGTKQNGTKIYGGQGGTHDLDAD